jgi:hypothetical protein
LSGIRGRFRPQAVIRISCSASDSYERFIANGLDRARNEFVHPSYGFSGANEDYKVPDPEPGDSERGFQFHDQVSCFRREKRCVHLERAADVFGDGLHKTLKFTTMAQPMLPPDRARSLFKRPYNNLATIALCILSSFNDKSVIL